jgi:hypothetical protein
MMQACIVNVGAVRPAAGDSSSKRAAHPGFSCERMGVLRVHELKGATNNKQCWARRFPGCRVLLGRMRSNLRALGFTVTWDPALVTWCPSPSSSRFLPAVHICFSTLVLQSWREHKQAKHRD